MHTITVFQAGEVPPQQLQAILAQYCLVERAQDLRREFLPQLVVVATLMILFAVFGVMSTVVCDIALVFVGSVAAWLVGHECHREYVLRQHLRDVPGATHQKVIKSS